MKNSIRIELQNHIEEVKSNLETLDQLQELHYYAFNEDYYIIGYYECSEWLKKHNLSQFEALEELQELQMEHFGEIQPLERINSETVVNQLVYFYGLELC